MCPAPASPHRLRLATPGSVAIARRGLHWFGGDAHAGDRVRRMRDRCASNMIGVDRNAVSTTPCGTCPLPLGTWTIVPSFGRRGGSDEFFVHVAKGLRTSR